MSSHPPHRVSHALSPDQQTDYLTWARALRLSKFGPCGPSEVVPKNPTTRSHPNVPETTNRRETSTAPPPKRKPAFRKVLRGKIEKFYERVLKSVGCRFQRRGGLNGLDPEERALSELQKEIKKEEKRRRVGGGGGAKEGDKERRERELKTARQVARAVREELKRRDTGGL